MLLVACTFCLTRTMFLEREVALFGSWLNSLYWGLRGSHTEVPAEHLVGEEAGGSVVCIGKQSSEAVG